MRRPLVMSTGVLALALMPAFLAAQTPTAPPAEQQPPAEQAQTEKPAEEPPKVPFESPAGVLLVQIKPDQTAVFEEMVGKLKAGLARTDDAKLRQQAQGLTVYRAAEPFGANALYVVMAEPTVPAAEYELFAMLQKTMTEEELRAEDAAAMWKRYADAFAAGLAKLSLTPVGATR
jgi:hypothetical protein